MVDIELCWRGKPKNTNVTENTPIIYTPIIPNICTNLLETKNAGCLSEPTVFQLSDSMCTKGKKMKCYTLKLPGKAA